MLEISIGAEKIFEVAGFPVTNTLLTSWLVVAFFIIVSQLIVRKVQLIPAGIQNVSEFVVEGVLGLMGGVLGSRSIAEKYFPLIATIFIFILASNLFDFLPIFGSFGFHRGEEFIPFFHPVNADLNTTLALAIISFFVIEVSGILTLGVLKYGSKFVNVRAGAMMFVVGLLELIGNLARLISFSFRLFGAIFAGEVLLMVVGTFVPYFLPVPLMAFEAFIGLLQAAIFAILTLALNFLGFSGGLNEVFNTRTIDG